MQNEDLWLFQGLRTPFCKVDGDLSDRNAIDLGVPVVQSMVEELTGSPGTVVWGEVAPTLQYSNIARETWLDADLDPSVTALSTRMACSTSMAAVFDAVGYLNGSRNVALCGGAESMSNVQVGLTMGLSKWMRRITQSSGPGEALGTLADAPITQMGLDIPGVKNRTTGKSMGEHCEEMAKTWDVSRDTQDELALGSHQKAVAGRDNNFFEELIVGVDDVSSDAFPRPDTSKEVLAGLSPAFDPGDGTLTAGNSSPLTDGAAGVWLATDSGRNRFDDSHRSVRLVDWETAAVDIFNEGLLMAPAYAIPRLLDRHDFHYEDIDIWEIHEAFGAQVACHIKALESDSFLRERVGIDREFGEFPRERINPNGGSIALGHPFAATGARILSQTVKELAEKQAGTRAIVSICANGGLGTVCLLESA
ncbi:MAG: acetyl-CoA C-acyltransferase [bacterium]